MKLKLHNLMATDCEVCGVMVMILGSNVPSKSCYCTHLNLWKPIPEGVLAVFGEMEVWRCEWCLCSKYRDRG